MRHLLIFVLLASTAAWGRDFTTDVRSGYDEPESESGSYFEVGGVIAYVEESFNLCCTEKEEGFQVDTFLSGEYRRNRFFIEATFGTFDGLTSGISLFQGKKWVVDLVLASALGRISDDDFDNVSELSEQDRNRFIETRDTFFNGAGIRATLYWDEYVFQYRFVKDTHGGNGLLSDIKIGRGWQYRNWNFHAIANVKWASSDLSNYWFGIDEDIATERHPAFETNSGFFYSTEIGLTYPVTQHWVFRTAYRYGDIASGQASRSSLVSSGYDATLYSSLSYVF